MSKFAIGLLTLAVYAASLPVIAMITPAKAASSSSKHIMHKKHRGPGFSDEPNLSDRRLSALRNSSRGSGGPSIPKGISRG